MRITKRDYKKANKLTRSEKEIVKQKRLIPIRIGKYAGPMGNGVFLVYLKKDLV